MALPRVSVFCIDVVMEVEGEVGDVVVSDSPGFLFPSKEADSVLANAVNTLSKMERRLP